MQSELKEFLPVGLLILAAVGFAVTNVALPMLIGRKRTHSAVKDSAYECGLPTLTEGQPRFSIKFYLIAMLFILFDIEVVFMLGWGVVFKDLARPVTEGGLGWGMLAGAAIFLLILEAGHIYAWKKGALDWAPRKGRK